MLICVSLLNDLHVVVSTDACCSLSCLEIADVEKPYFLRSWLSCFDFPMESTAKKALFLKVGPFPRLYITRNYDNWPIASSKIIITSISGIFQTV